MGMELNSMQITATRDWANSYSLSGKDLQLLALWDSEGDIWGNTLWIILFLLAYLDEKHRSQDHVAIFLASEMKVHEKWLINSFC